ADVTLRFATPSDVPTLVELCALHAEYEQAAFEADGKAAKLERALFGASPRLYALVAEQDNMLVGYATYMLQFSTWEAEPYIYMDCLYLREAARGQGLGRRFIHKIAENGARLGCTLIQWQTPDFNKGAIRFYRRTGTSEKRKVRFFLDTETARASDPTPPRVMTNVQQEVPTASIDGGTA
ncbi:MAG: GNAT family N-acetyltransferase, partial [Bacteroidota bacterium]